MSVETIAIVISAAALLLSFFGAFGWMVRRSDTGQAELRGEIAALDDKLSGQITALDDKLSARIDTVEQRLGDRIDALDERLSTRIDALDDKLSARIDGVEAGLVEVKIAVARLEGPPRHLLTAR